MQTADHSPATRPPAPDLVVVGAGIVGLAHAAEAVSRGLAVTVVERDQQAVGASIRNFGHICTTPQNGEALGYALTARQRWLTLGRKAGFEVQECGTVVLARCDEEQAVLDEFAETRGADQVQLLDPAAVRARVPFATDEVVGGAHLPLDIRVDPREAVPALAAWLAGEGVDFRWSTSVGSVEPGLVRTSTGDLAAERIVVATGHDVDRLFPAIAEEYDVQRCRLQMLEVAAPGGVAIDPAVLTGLSMLRYAGMAATAAAEDVRRRFEQEAPELLAAVVNLMLTQRPGGAVVLGDTHHYAKTHLPFEAAGLERLLLREGSRLFGSELTVLTRWRGVYASSTKTDFLVAEPHPGTRVVSVTSGIGMTTAFGLAPSVLDQLL